MMDRRSFARMPFVRACLFVPICFCAPFFAAASAQDVPDTTDLVESGKSALQTIEKRLNDAGLCEPLRFDIRNVSGVLGFPIPSFIPIDTDVRWDQSRQVATRFASSPTRVALDFDLGCEPSSNGMVLEFLGLSPEKLRLKDQVSCTGDRLAGGELGTLTCDVDGKVGRFLAKNMIGLSDKVARLLPMNLAVPVTKAATALTGAPPSRDGPEKPVRPVNTPADE